MSGVFVVTNDFPTRRGGIETFVLSLCEGMADEVEVYTASMPGDGAFDQGLAFRVHRDPRSRLLPTPAVSGRVVAAFRASGADRVVFGASAPLGLLAPALRAAGAHRIIALTHGHEVWWARAPGSRQLLRRIGRGCDVLTYVSEWCRDRIAPALDPVHAAAMVQLSPGVDVDRFRPDCGGAAVRTSLGIAPDAPVVVCTARMIARKGQDTLIEAWPHVLAVHPSARLLLVGDGPYRRRLERAAAPLGSSVVFAGSVAWSQMPAYTDAGDVFAMPCRTRLGGLEPEAFGIVFLEAAACGLPVIVGDSGGAPEAVVDGVTGFVVPPGDAVAVGARIIELFGDPARSREMGLHGRARATERWTWQHSRHRLSELLS